MLVKISYNHKLLDFFPTDNVARKELMFIIERILLCICAIEDNIWDLDRVIFLKETLVRLQAEINMLGE